MKAATIKRVRCAIYTRVSTDQGLEQDFNSLDAQYDASHAYIRSQAHAGWVLLRGKYDDGGFSGGNTDRPALRRLLDEVEAGRIDVIVVYKVDRLTVLWRILPSSSNCSTGTTCRSSRSPSSSIPPPRWDR
jgi:site-specific DNA recombinase